MHWETLSCPNRHCACDGLPFGQGVLVQDGSSQGHTQALCQAWGQRMALTDATADCGLDTAPQLCALAVRVLAEGHALHATARMVQRDKETVTSTTLHPSVVERDPLTWHDHHRRLRRTTLAFSQALPWWEQHVWVSWAYEHVCWPHQRLRQRLPAPEPTRGSGTPRRWQPVTPAMAAGITARVWTTAELLGYRIPATCLDTLDEREPLFPDPDAVYHVH